MQRMYFASPILANFLDDLSFLEQCGDADEEAAVSFTLLIFVVAVFVAVVFVLCLLYL